MDLEGTSMQGQAVREALRFVRELPAPQRAEFLRELAADGLFVPVDSPGRVRLVDAADGLGGWPGIESRPEVCGGDPCIANTRIPVWALEQARRVGYSEADLLRSYPDLRAEDLVHAWAYVEAHSGEVERLIREHEDA